MFDRRKFRAELALRDMSFKDLAKLLKLNESTVYRKVNADGDFSRAEINIMIDELDLQNPDSIFFTKTLA